MISYRQLLGALAVCCLPLTTASAAIIVDNTVAGTVTNTFEGIASGNVVGFIAQTGALYGESFAGQTVGVSGSNDTISGVPTAPLTLLANPDLFENIGILTVDSSQTIYGDRDGDVGEGALSVLLAAGSDIFGLDIVGNNNGDFTIHFYGEDGIVFDELTQSIPTDGFFGFRATAGEIIRGVTITNTDGGGIAYDNVTFNELPVGEVPEPASLTLLGIGLAGLVGARLRKQQIA